MITFGGETRIGARRRLDAFEGVFRRACFRNPGAAGATGGGGGGGAARGIFAVRKQHLSMIRKALTEPGKVTTAQNLIKDMPERGVEFKDITPEELLAVLSEIVAVKADRPDLADLVELAENAIALLRLEEAPPPVPEDQGATAAPPAAVTPPTTGENTEMRLLQLLNLFAERPQALRDICTMYAGRVPETGDRGDMNDLRPRALSLLQTGNFTQEELENACTNASYPPSARAGALALTMDVVGRENEKITGMPRIAFLESRLQADPELRNVILKYLHDEYRMEVRVLSARSERAQAEVSAREEVIDKLKKELETARVPVAAAPQPQIEVQEPAAEPQALEGLTRTFEQYQARIVEISKAQERAGAEILERQQELDDLREEIIPSFENQLAEAEKRIEGIRPDLEKAQGQLGELSDEIERITTALGKITGNKVTDALKKKALLHQQKTLEAQYEELIDQEKRIKSRLSPLTARKEELEADIEAAAVAAKALEDIIEGEGRKIEELEAQKSAVRSEAGGFALGAIAREIERAESRLATVNTYLDAVKALEKEVQAFADPEPGKKA